MSTSNVMAQALYNTLSGGTALTSLLGGTAIYYMQAPDGAVLPYCVFSLQGGGPENTDPHDRRSLIYFVRGYAGTAKRAGEIDAAASALLHKQALSVSGWNVIWLARETDLEMVETPQNGTPVFMAGATYRIRMT